MDVWPAAFVGHSAEAEDIGLASSASELPPFLPWLAALGRLRCQRLQLQIGDVEAEAPGAPTDTARRPSSRVSFQVQVYTARLVWDQAAPLPVLR